MYKLSVFTRTEPLSVFHGHVVVLSPIFISEDRLTFETFNDLIQGQRIGLDCHTVKRRQHDIPISTINSFRYKVIGYVGSRYVI